MLNNQILFVFQCQVTNYIVCDVCSVQTSHFEEVSPNIINRLVWWHAYKTFVKPVIDGNGPSNCPYLNVAQVYYELCTQQLSNVGSSSNGRRISNVDFNAFSTPVGRSMIKHLKLELKTNYLRISSVFQH